MTTIKTAKTWAMVAALAVGLVTALAPDDAEAKGKARKTRVELNGKLNLNEATAAQLDELPGVGEKAAERIIAYRKKKPFARIEELVNVKGFGKKKFEKLKAHLSVSGPTNLTAKRVKMEAPAAAPTASAAAASTPSTAPPPAQAQGRFRGRR